MIFVPCSRSKSSTPRRSSSYRSSATPGCTPITIFCSSGKRPIRRSSRKISYTTVVGDFVYPRPSQRSEEHTSELQSRVDLVCRLLLEKKKKIKQAKQERSSIQ